MLNELKEAVLRGVEVRLLYDPKGSIIHEHTKYDKLVAFFGGLSDQMKTLNGMKGGFILDEFGNKTNVRAKFSIVSYNDPINLDNYVKNWFIKLKNIFRKIENKEEKIDYGLTHLLHDKILLVDANTDNSYAIFGGRNIASAFYMLDSAEHNFKDFEVFMKIPSTTNKEDDFALVLQNYFDRLYYRLGNRYLEKSFLKISKLSRNQESQKLNQAIFNLKYRSNLNLEELISEMVENNFINSDFTKSNVSLLHALRNTEALPIKAEFSPRLLKLRIFKRIERYSKNSVIPEFRKVLKKAKSKIDIVSPYARFTITDAKLFRYWLGNNSKHKLRIFAPSLIGNDLLTAQAFFEKITVPMLEYYLKPFIDNGQVEIRLYGTLKEKDIKYKRKRLLKSFFLKIEKIIDKIYHPNLHTKLIRIDDNMAFVTSFNWSGRAKYQDSESGIFVNDSIKNSKFMKDVINYIDELEKDTHLWKDEKWRELRSHRNLKQVYQYRGALFFIKLLKLLKLDTNI